MPRHLILSLLGVLSAASASGVHRVTRTYDQADGLPVSRVVALAQDSDGFLWVSTAGGVARYDGTEMRPWGIETLKRNIDWLIPGPAGELLLLPESGQTLFQRTRDGIEPLPGPDGAPFGDVVHAVFSGDGSLWVARRAALFRRELGRTSWERVPIQLAAGEVIRRVRTGRPGELLLVTNRGVRALADGALATLWTSWLVGDVIRRSDGALFIVEKLPDAARVVEVAQGRTLERLMLRGANANCFALRGMVVWLALDRFLVALRDGQAAEVIGPESGLTMGGNVIVDREGSLWQAGRGLTQFPEPETLVFDEHQGLPGSHVIDLHETAEGLWVSTWQGLGRLERTAKGWSGKTVSLNAGALCEDRTGVLWAERPRRQGRSQALNLGSVWACASSADGTVWLVGSLGLAKTTSAVTAPVRFETPFGATYSGGQVLEDRSGLLWVSEDERICHAEAVRVLNDDNPQWSCDTLEGIRDVQDIAETPMGAIWAGGWGGLWQWKDGKWARLEGAKKLAAPLVAAMVVSTRGGVWVLGPSGILRVVERPDLVDGWEIVERLSFWQGVPSSGGADVIEEADGTLWVGTDLAGVVRVPAEARKAQGEPPVVRVIDLRVDGESRETSSPVLVPPGRTKLELRFAALTFRDRGRLRFQYRLQHDSAWQEARLAEPVFRFFSLPPGAYSAEVRASLDGVSWSRDPARIDFEVERPWYRSSSAMVLGVALVAVLLLAAHRLRVARLLGLERQRSRIARDLHDEIGSGLGSIGLLSGLAAGDAVGEEQRRSLLERISEASAELGTALADIVWSLRQGSSSLEDLVSHVTRRGSRLFPDGKTVFDTDLPRPCPRVDLALPVRRNVMLIAFETLHNAARHARARRVILGIAPAGRHWRLWVSDDGVGLEGNKGSRGLGLASMHQRAAEIDALLSLHPAEQGGTVVDLVFSADGRGRARGC